jgi:hypothetical protein
LEVDFFDGGHRWNGTRAYALLAETLRMDMRIARLKPWLKAKRATGIEPLTPASG